MGQWTVIIALSYPKPPALAMHPSCEKSFLLKFSAKYRRADMLVQNGQKSKQR